MSATPDRSSPLLVLELVENILNHIDAPSDLFNCSRVNSLWSNLALRKLYRGSMNDMLYRTPDIPSLESLFLASREDFAQNMQYVKHLSITADAAARERREGYQVSSDSQNAKLFLRPNGTGPTSLAIPFELIAEDIFPFCQHLLHADLKSMSIADAYCAVLRLDSSREQEPISSVSFPKADGLNPTELTSKNLSSLEALSMYRSNIPLESTPLCERLLLCDLKVFQLSQASIYAGGLSKSEAVRLLQSLWQQNLEALALRVLFSTDTGKICADLKREMRTPCWPKLKALYLYTIDEQWLEMLPEFNQLSILELRISPTSLTPSFAEIAYSISRCQNLVAIEIECTRGLAMLVGIAQSCPQLRKFRAFSMRRAQHMQRAQLSVLCEALPLVECLSLPVLATIYASGLRALANFCPRLRVLDLAKTQLPLSLDTLVETPPLVNLEAMDFASIRFDGKVSMKQSERQQMADEWGRVFPKIRRVPTLGRWGLTGRKPSDIELTNWLWKSLRYEPPSELDLHYMWQTNFEIKTFGWPVVEAHAYESHKSHSFG